MRAGRQGWSARSLPARTSRSIIVELSQVVRITGDGTVNVLDLIDLLLAFGTACP